MCKILLNFLKENLCKESILTNEGKSDVMKYFSIYFIIINLIAFIIYGIDKYKAKRNHWRISEKMLLVLAAAGGFAGAFIGMRLFHHKTKHKKFVIGVPLIAILWIIGIGLIFIQKSTMLT